MNNNYNEQYIKWIKITMHDDNKNNEQFTMTMNNDINILQ